jgi:predicted metalloendopeptidase
MSNLNLEGLPPEMQQRLADIVGKAQAQAAAPQPQQQQAPIQKQPTLMDHTVALRQEVAALRQELHAVAQVTDAVGQAVGQLYQTFLGQSEVTDQGGYYEETEQPDY